MNRRAYSVGTHRLLYRAIARGIAVPAGFTAEEIDAGGPRAIVVREQGQVPAHDLFVLHGGGYSAGSLATHVPVTTGLCAEVGAAGLVVDYRRAPAHPFPAALDDARAAWQWWTSRPGAAEGTAIYGDSAGAGLALSLMMELRDRDDPLPTAAYLVSPFVDLTDHRRPGNPAVVDDVLAGVGRIYVRDHDPRDPMISPIFGDLSGLPPLLVQCGEGEMLADDGRRLVQHARECGVDVTLETYRGFMHELPLMTRISARARELNASGGAFLRQRLAATPGPGRSGSPPRR